MPIWRTIHPMFRNVGIISNLGVRKAKDTLRQLVDFLLVRKCHVLLDSCAAEILSEPFLEQCTGAEMGSKADLVIAVGGDGTLLMATRVLLGSDVPLLGINMGHIGFLTDISATDLKEELGKILDGDYEEERRLAIHGEVLRGGKVIGTVYAFNEIVIQKWNIARLIELHTYIDGRFLHKHRSDGMIVATPTGSTAYALSVGGPILHPALNVLLLAPICPRALGNRPIVAHGDSCVRIDVSTGDVEQARLGADGGLSLTLEPGDQVFISRLESQVRLIHPSSHDQYQVLRDKLNWSL
ncbi:MAG: NAD(+) kinase [Candidatus Eutrophobiaceae bacterium]